MVLTAEAWSARDLGIINVSNDKDGGDYNDYGAKSIGAPSTSARSMVKVRILGDFFIQICQMSYNLNEKRKFCFIFSV
jgi:hypothetical protein